LCIAKHQQKLSVARQGVNPKIAGTHSTIRILVFDRFPKLIDGRVGATLVAESLLSYVSIPDFLLCLRLLRAIQRQHENSSSRIEHMRTYSIPRETGAHGDEYE
jgi:hypothetical protein